MANLQAKGQAETGIESISEVAMKDERRPQLLANALDGDITAFEALTRNDHSTLQEYAAQVKSEELVLRLASVRRVLVALEQGEVSSSLVQEWASFMRRGYISDGYLSSIGSHPPQQLIQAITISYDSSAEEQIAGIISRLDEIGDLIDGEVTRREIETMLNELP